MIGIKKAIFYENIWNKFMNMLKNLYATFLAFIGYGLTDIDKQNLVESLRNPVVMVQDKDSHKMTIQDRLKYYQTQAVSVAMIDDNKIAWAKAYQSSPDLHTHENIDERTLFQAASISKPVTAMGVLLLVQQGKLSLDKDVNTYLKSWKVPENEFTVNEKVTLRRLLSHTAGISVHGFAGYDEQDEIPTTIEILRGKNPKVNSGLIEVISVPGTQHKYSGGGTTIVQLLIEDITGEKFDVWMKKNILTPFGMTSSSFEQPLNKENRKHAATGYYQNGKQVVHVYPEKAAAGLWTTPTDLAKFAIKVSQISDGTQSGPINQNLIKEALTIQHPIEGYGGVGLGFFIKKSKNKPLSFSHSGGNEGFAADFVMYPELKKGCVVMINHDNAWNLIPEIEKSIAYVYGIKKD
jgi:CubicO group peptidase (beta-lactamase class C family)